MAEYPREQLVLFFLASTAGISILAVAVVSFFFVYQKKLMEEQQKRKKMQEENRLEILTAVLQSQETERKWIASEIHDNLSALLFTIQFSLAEIKDSLSDDELQKHGDKLNNVILNLKDAIDSTKSIARKLVPVSIGIVGLSGSLRDYCNRLSFDGFRISFSESGISIGLNPDVALHIFRILQELISNSIKHSGGNLIRVHLNWDTNGLTVRFQDNGKGFQLPPPEGTAHTGMGLINLLSRLEIIKAKVIDDGEMICGFSFTFRIENEQH